MNFIQYNIDSVVNFVKTNSVNDQQLQKFGPVEKLFVWEQKVRQMRKLHQEDLREFCKN